jgi:asparagine synthase (glutamine-hydrolysing)
MCGIAGVLAARAVKPEVAEAMARTLAHRGPDDEGIWLETDRSVAFGHRRLAIVDLSAQGHQPMLSDCRRYALTYNGEIYNYRELRARLDDGSPWRGHSDTEVILRAFARWGPERALESFVGMFALALWDRQARTLYLARDRLGEKPLYYASTDDGLVFGSELKALRAHPSFRSEIDRDVLPLLLRHGYIPAPHSIYRHCWKLEAGAFVAISRDASGQVRLGKPARYWDATAAAAAGMAAPFQGSDHDAIARLDALLREAVGLQMVADVPLGAFLSGGIDSSTVVALMQAQSERPVKTFTIGFELDKYDEARHAREVAKHLGTDHTELYVTPAEALSVIPLLPTMYDEPFADSSQIPTYLVSRLARREVTVSLSGDGGDELFGGYSRYALGEQLLDRSIRAPALLKRGIALSIEQVSPQGWDAAIGGATTLMRRRTPTQVSGHRLHRLAAVLRADNFGAMYRAMVSQWQHPAEVVQSAREPETLFTRPESWEQVPDTLGRMMLCDTITYLPDDLLVKVDRAAMAVALESRVPFLDHRVVEFAWTLPRRLRVRDGKGKWILRQVLRRYVPDPLVHRPKMGFGVPLDSWLRGPLREWAEALLEPRRLQREGFFDAAGIRLKWDEHLSGRYDREHYLWSVLMFQAWLAAQ